MPRGPITTLPSRGPVGGGGMAMPGGGQFHNPGEDWGHGPGGFGNPDAFPSGAQTLGNPMYPWLMPWNGPHVAPMTDMQNQILQNMFKMYGGGGDTHTGWNQSDMATGLGVQGPGGNAGTHTDLTYVNQTKDALQKIKDYQDAGALKRIASSAAAGGNALSGARIGAEHDYLGQSGAQYENTIGQLMQSALENERNRQNALAIASTQAAPGMASVHQREAEALMQNRLAGMGMLWGASGLPQQLGSQELQGQYADWLRQIGMLRDEQRYPDQLAMQMLHGGGYGGQTPNQYGPSQAAGWASLIAALFGNGGSGGFANSTGGQIGGGIMQLLQGLFGGGGGGGYGYDDPYAASIYDYPIGPNQPDDVPALEPGSIYDNPIGPTQPNPDMYGPYPEDYFWGY